jgi:hypothetical protein
MTASKKLFLMPLFFVLLNSCGSSKDQMEILSAQDDMPKVSLTEQDFFRTELTSGEFTDEVDEKRYRAVGETMTEFAQRARIIYFVGSLRRVPTHAKIQVKWFNNNIEEPMAIADVYGSDNFSFISNFTPPGKRFIPGDYSAKVFVNDQLIDSREFKISGRDPFAEGITVAQVRFAKKLNKNNQPIKPSNRFPWANAIYATFSMKNVMSPIDVEVKWYRGDSLFNQSMLHIDGNGSFNVNIASSSGLPQGAYNMVIEHNGVILNESKFALGKASLGPVIDKIYLGERLGSNGLPKEAGQKFKKGIQGLHCGLRFLDLSPDSEILIEWVMIEGSSESIYHRVVTPVPGGGSGTMSAEWSPGEIYPGKYKAVVYINNEFSLEKEFSVN